MSKNDFMEQTPASNGDDGRLVYIKEHQRNDCLNRLPEKVTKISNYNTFSSYQLEVKLSLLERQLEYFEKIQSQLESLDDSQFDQNHRFQFEEVYFRMKSIILERLSIVRQNSNQPLMNSTQYQPTLMHQPSKPHLPTLQLTKFSGSYNDWTEFFNMFCMLVHENPHLSPISKFQYLRSCLTDGAARLIQSLDITPENYDQAIEILKSRYDNKRLIFQAHIEKIFTIKEHSRPNVSEVRNLIDLVNANLRALKSIATQSQISEGIILHMITSKLDPETQAKWEEETCSIWNEQSSLQVLSLPTWNDLSKFLERRCKTLEIVSRTSSPKQIVSHRRPLSNPHSSSTNRSELSSYIATNQTRCCFCNSTPSHNAFNCRRFNEMSTYDRFRTVKKMKLCINCLGVSHLANSCPSNNKCQHCKAAHHILLHRDQMSQCSPTTNNQHTNEATSMETESPVALQALKKNNQVILGTARVELQAPNGRSVTVRALLDSGSQLHFITEKIAHYLRVQRNKVNIKITGIANKTSDAFTDCRLIIKSSTNEYSTPITAVIIPSITSYQPQKLDIDCINIPSNIRLADKHFYKPGAIDLLIGAGLFYELLMVGQIKADNLPIFQKTSLGWIVTGEVKRIKQEELNSNIKIDLNSPQQPSSSQSTNNNNSNHTSDGMFSFVCLHSATKPLYTTISNSGEPLLEHISERFWRIEQPICDNIRTAEEEECERFF